MKLPLYIRRADDITERTLDAIERFFDSPALERAIWAVLILSVIYFGPVIFTITNR